MRRLAFALIALTACVTACGGDEATSSHVDRTTFARIQSNIFSPSCAVAGCHVAGAEFARQSGLVLQRGVAYRNLVGVRATLAGAQAAGLWRVKPGDPDSSLLFLKLHAGLASASPQLVGSPMPFGGTPLTVGQLEFVREWIAAGASETGDVVDTTLLADHTAQVVEPFTPLAPPTQGYQLHVGPFAVAPNFERELFVRRRIGNPTEIYVNRIETQMRPGSHHFLVYTFEASMPAAIVPPTDVVRDIRNPDGSMNLLNMVAMEYHLFFGGSMMPYSDFHFPPGVALRVPADASFDLNSHYVNHTAGAAAGEAYANLYTVDASQVQHAASTLFLNNLSFTLPAHQVTTVTRRFVMPARTTIVALTSHMHKHGTRFVIRIRGGARDGEVIYTNTDWAHPAFTAFDQPIVLEAGEALESEATFDNQTDRLITFGLTSEDEMDIIFGYAY